MLLEKEFADLGSDFVQREIADEAQRLAIPDCKPALSKEAQEALRRCLAPSRADRPDAAALLRDPYFAAGGKAK